MSFLRTRTLHTRPAGCRDGRIRVCLLVDDIGPDAGAERQVAETVRRLNPGLVDAHVCCLADSARLRELGERFATAVFPLEGIFTRRGVQQVLRFRGYLKRHRIEVVHSFMVKTSIFAVLAGMGLRRTAVVTSRLNTGYWYTPFYIRLFRVLNRFTAGIFSNSEGARRIAAATEKIPESSIAVVYNGVDIARYAAGAGNPEAAARLGIPASARVVGIVSNLRPVKDLPLFVRAAAVVARRVPDAVFLLVGQGPLRDQLERLAAEAGIADRVFFTDGRGEVPDYLRRMSVGCLSSHGEGFSNAILEYMAAGLPVVATDAGGNAEAVEDGVTGYLVRERTPEAFAAPVIGLLESEDRRAAMGRRGLERCRERFSIGRYAEDLQEFYRALARPAAEGR